MRILFFLVLMAGIGNTVLRPALENPYTLYRLIAPILLLAIVARRPAFATKYGFWFAIFVGYNFILATLYSSNYSEFLPSIVHYLYIFILLVALAYMRETDDGFERSFLKFVDWFFVFILVNLLIEYLIGPYFPNLYEDDSGDGSLRAFYWNQNDLAVVLCMIGWIVLCLGRYGVMTRVLVSVTIAFILIINDSKAALMSFLAITIPASLVMYLVPRMRVPRQVWLIGGFAVVMLVVAALIAFRDASLSFASDTYSLGSLLVDPVVNILRLSPSGDDLGSISNRTDAAIFVIIEYVRSYGLGLGAGGSWLVLAQPEYKLGGAESPHNALLQFIVDFGYPVLLGYLYALGWALRKMFTRGISTSERLKVVAVLSFPILGLSQSGAIVTNYFFWVAMFFIWFLKAEPVKVPRVAGVASSAGVDDSKPTLAMSESAAR